MRDQLQLCTLGNISLPYHPKPKFRQISFLVFNGQMQVDFFLSLPFTECITLQESWLYKEFSVLIHTSPRHVFYPSVAIKVFVTETNKLPRAASTLAHVLTTLIISSLFFFSPRVVPLLFREPRHSIYKHVCNISYSISRYFVTEEFLS